MQRRRGGAFLSFPWRPSDLNPLLNLSQICQFQQFHLMLPASRLPSRPVHAFIFGRWREGITSIPSDPFPIWDFCNLPLTSSIRLEDAKPTEVVVTPGTLGLTGWELLMEK